MIEIIGKLVIVILWGILFITNMINIARNKIDAETGVLWAVIIGGFQICIGVLNVKWADMLENLSAWLIEIEQFLLTYIMYSHGIEVTEMRKKNNELAIQLALLKTQLKAIEEEDHAAKQ